jgi:hypothetical protein
MLDILKDTKRYIGDIVGIKVENILYLIFFSNQGSLGSMVGRALGNVGKDQKNYFDPMKVPKRTSWMLKILMF